MAAHRTSVELCFVMWPRCTLGSDSRWLGVCPAYEHSWRASGKRVTSPISATMIAAVMRPTHIALFRSWMEARGLASTIDRRLSTVCGFYRFAHIDGRIWSSPAQYVRRPRVHPSDAQGLDRSEVGVFLFTAEHYDRDHAA